MIGQDYHLLGSKPWRIKSSDEHVGARTTPLGYTARLKQKIPCLHAPLHTVRFSSDLFVTRFLAYLNGLDFSVRLVKPVTCRPTRLPSQSSAAPPVARVLSPSAPWQLFPTDARPVRPH